MITIEEKAKYKLDAEAVNVEFAVCSIDRKADSVYVKFTSPTQYAGIHQGFVLSSMENNQHISKID